VVVFPAAGPLVRSGPGVLLWTAPRGCAAERGGTASAARSGGTGGGGTGGSTETLDAALGVDDLPGPGHALVPAAGDLAVVTAATGTAAGEVLTVGASGAVAVSGYLGDAVLASPVRSPRGGWKIAVRAQRHYDSALGRPRLVPAGAGPVEAVAAALDYRAEILLVWADRGGVYARELPAAGAAGPARRLGSAGADPEIGALLSDDGHAIVAWRSHSAMSGGGSGSAPRRDSGSVPNGGSGSAPGDRGGAGGASTAIELSLFEVGPGATLEPGSLRQVERFRDPPGFPSPPGSLRLIRLSSEAVVMAWTGLSGGRYVVRASPVSLRRGAWAPVTISAPGAASPVTTASTPGAVPSDGGDAVLADLVPGPHAEALALWMAGPRLRAGGPGRAGSGPWAIFAARGHYAGLGEVAFEAPEPVAPPGSNGPPAAAFDPQSGRALAAWVTRPRAAGANRIAYALRPFGPASAPPPASARAAMGASRLTVALPLLAVLLLVAAAALGRGVGRRRGGGHVRARRG
jgi:hypothetical protein